MVVWLTQAKIDIWKFHFIKVFFDQKTKTSPREISVAETLQDPPGTHFFPDPPPFLKFWIEGCPPAENGEGGGGWIVKFTCVVKITIGVENNLN